MKKLTAAAILGAGIFLGFSEAHAVFTYVPDSSAPDAPIIQENASDAYAGKPLPKAAPLVVPKQGVQAPRPAPQSVYPAASAQPAQINPKVGIGPSTASQREIKNAEALIKKARGYEARKEAGNARTAAMRPTAARTVAPAPLPVYQPAAPYAANALAQGAPPLVIGRGSMREQLIAYAGGMGYQVTWNSPNDLIVTNETVFSTGTFAGNLRELFETLQRIGRRDMSATLFQGNRTIVVEPARR